MPYIEEELKDLKEQVAALTAALRNLRPRESAWIPEHATIGEDVKLAPNTSLQCREDAPITVGAGTNIYRNAEIFGPVTIGAKCLINRDGYIRAGTVIEDRVFIGPFVRLITDGHEIGDSQRRAGTNASAPIVIGEGSWIGASSTILGGVTIGKGCIVAAGSLVNHDVPDNTLVGGVPAKVIRSLPA
ncbi:transferase hexapeptide (six repeat-containing protein) [Arthrobacter sp. ok909]|jgi:acetyltransferase-like isoleucine patch superfamily enzyme|uniref:acyltransferase n=1 Tax=Arthrobacter sp. ok909 TaxID=1761746 RepID=UPI00088BD217|nr:DapH/DapD/GlmU-related protein [Arthrobacter sp. ok909]SDP53051.1 transferase hexapeptide (six repeat-containing protein) [Arthrobacter sp. ok909]